jgi:methionyl-tRNA formyltransferase
MRLVYFGNHSDFSSEIFKQILKNKDNYNIEIVLTIDTENNNISYFKRFLACCIKKIFNFFDVCSTDLTYYYFTDFAKKYHMKILKTNNLNENSFIKNIKKMNVDFAIVAGCGVIFSKELIESFKYGVINYHNSLLPKYKGLGGKTMPFYFNEKEFGYTFHYMNEKIDEGNILLQYKIPIQKNKTIKYHHQLLSYSFKETIPILLQKIIKKDKGYKQKIVDSYFGNKEISKLRKIDEIEKKTFEELNHLIKCFGYFEYNGMKITKISKDRKILRINYLPTWLFYTVRKIIK